MCIRDRAYHILLDGFCNAVCSFTLNTIVGSTQAPPIVGNLGISPPTGPLCNGGTFQFSAVGVTGIGTYTWTLPDGTVVPDAPGVIDWTFGASGQICVQGDNGCDQTPQVCMPLVATDLMVTEEIVVCPDDPGGFAIFSGNGQIFPPNGNNVGSFETTTVVYSDPNGCQVNAQVSVMYVQPNLTPQVEIICAGQPPTLCIGCPPQSGIHPVTTVTPDGLSLIHI